MIAVGKNGGGARSVIPDAGNDGVSVRDIMVNSRNGWICVYCKFPLEAES
jgi:hypothetical protein